MFNAGFRNLSGKALRYFDRLGYGPPLGNEPRDIGAGRHIAAFLEGLDMHLDANFAHSRSFPSFMPPFPPYAAAPVV